jgi:hypothetical protein
MTSTYVAESSQKKRADVYLNNEIFCSLKPLLSEREQPLAAVREYFGLGYPRKGAYLFVAPARVSEKTKKAYLTQQYYRLACSRSAKHVEYGYAELEQIRFTVREGSCPSATACFPPPFATTRESPHTRNKKLHCSVSFVDTNRAD